MADKTDNNLKGNAPLAPNNEANDLLSHSEAAAGDMPNPTATGNTALSRITLESTQSIQNVVELHEKLLLALQDSDKIEIDASAIQQIDTTSLQLMLVLKRSAINLEKEVSIDFPSERFVEAATLLGLAEMLEVDQAAAGFF